MWSDRPPASQALGAILFGPGMGRINVEREREREWEQP